MNRTFKLTTSLAVAVLSGCATQSANNFQAFSASDLDAEVKTGALVQKTQNLLAIVDSSSSTSKIYQGGFDQSLTKFSVEKELLNRMNQTIPSINLNAGIRSFGSGPCTSWGSTQLKQAMSSYSKSEFSAGISALTCSSGGSPMHKALQAANTDLSNVSGQSAVIIFSDGHDLDSTPIPAAKTLQAQYGDNVCIYGVWTGNEEDKTGRYLLQELSNISGCGFTTSAADISTDTGMASFVTRVLLEQGTVTCPGTPAGVPVGPDGCALDSDGDGVPDYQDKCPDTPKGAIVNVDGCWVYEGVFFDFDKATIKPEYYSLFDNAVDVLNGNLGLTVDIEGHTDSVGADAYNQSLSERRAASVKQYLVEHGIDPARLNSKGYGESDPIATNETNEGRARNRRVGYTITGR